MLHHYYIIIIDGLLLSWGCCCMHSVAEYLLAWRLLFFGHHSIRAVQC
jgi:hypothetical protein